MNHGPAERLKGIGLPIAKRIYGAWRQRREAREFAKHRELKNLYAIFGASLEGEWIIGRNDALNIYKMVKRYGSKNALDLGTGIGTSAAVLALAMPGNGKVTTIEQSPKCIKLARELIPPSLQRTITFLRSDAWMFQNRKISKYLFFSGYLDVPSRYGPFDFVVVDGPSSWLEGHELVGGPNGDIINLLPYLTPGCKIYIDDRRKMVPLYLRYLSLYLRLVEAQGVYTLLERTDKPLRNIKELKVMDSVLKKRLETTYFR